MFRPLTANDVHKIMEEKLNKKMAAFEKIYVNCQNRILKHAKNDQYKCLYEVPEYVSGLPLYDINSCIQYLITNLTKNGYYVKYFFPKILYISWDLGEIRNEKYNKPVVQQIQYQQPQHQPLMPPPRMYNGVTPMNETEAVNASALLLPQPQTSLLPHPIASRSIGKLKKTNNQNSTFIKSIKDYKPSGKFVLNLD
jgi:hypothetical protein